MPAKMSALLVDFDNLVARHGQAMVDNIAAWVAWLEDGGFDPEGRKRTFLRKRVYWNIQHDDVHRLPFKRRLFDTRVCRAVRNKDKGSSADFDITIDAAELRHEFKRIKEVIVLSYDSDFLTVMNHLQVFEIDVVGMAKGNERPAQAFRELADFVIEFEEFQQAFSYERPKRGLLDGFAPKKKTAKSLESPKAAMAAAPPPAAAPTSAAPKRVRRGRGKAVKRSFDMKAAAAVITKAAVKSPSARLSKKFVTKALGSVEGFSLVGASAWLSAGSYPAMIQKLAAETPKLDLETAANGGLFLIYKGAEQAGGNA